MRRIILIAYGSFNQLMGKMLSEYFEIVVYHHSESWLQKARDDGYEVMHDFSEIEHDDVLLIGVPISVTQQILHDLVSYLSATNVVIEQCSVKVYPEKWCRKILWASNIPYLLTHPMYWPRSYPDKMKGRKYVICDEHSTVTKEWMTEWVRVMQLFWLEIVEISPSSHDHEAAYSQWLTHFLSRKIDLFGIHDSLISTHWFDQLKELTRATVSHSDVLYEDMKRYNPFFLEMQEKIQLIIQKDQSEHPSDPSLHSDAENPLIHVLWPAGSFSDIAAQTLKIRHEMQYCVSFSHIMQSLKKYGWLALVPTRNTYGWLVSWLTDVVAERENIRVRWWVHLPVKHVLATRHPDTPIRNIHAHPQALIQCASYIQSEYPDAILHKEPSNTSYLTLMESWDGIILAADTARDHGLTILNEPFAPDDNVTTFVVIERKEQPVEAQNLWITDDRSLVIFRPGDHPWSMADIYASLVDLWVNVHYPGNIIPDWEGWFLFPVVTDKIEKVEGGVIV